MTIASRARLGTAVRGGQGRGWGRFLVRRVSKAVVTMFIIVTIAFFVLRLSGTDPVRAALGPNANAQLIAERRSQLGLDLPLWQQYINYLSGLLHGNIGTSLINGRSVSDLLATRLPATLELAGVAFLIVLFVAIPVGLGAAIIAERRRANTEGPVFATVSGFFATVPEYLLGVALVIVFAIGLKWFPVAGADTPLSYVLPATAMAVASTATLARLARVEALGVLKQDYIRTARSKQLPAFVIYFRHALPNMLTATLAFGGVLLGMMITSGVLVENVFNWPGMGQLFVNAVATKDYGIVQGLALVYAAIILALLLLVDIVLALLDPRSTITEDT